MGNHQAKRSKSPQLSPNELDVLSNSFNCVAGERRERITEPTLMQSWTTRIDRHLAQYMANFLYKPVESTKRPTDPAMKGARLLSINFVNYTKPFYFLERGSMNEKAQFIMDSLDNVTNDAVQYSQVQTYVKTVIRNYVQVIQTRDEDPFKKWNELGYTYNEDDLDTLANALMVNLNQDEEHPLSPADLENWLQMNVIVLNILREILCYLYGFCGPIEPSTSGGHLPSHSNQIPTNPNITHSNDELLRPLHSPPNIIPKLTGFPDIDKSTYYKPILNILQIIYLNSIIPNKLSNEWRFLFSSSIMGESFSTMLGKIMDKGPTLIIVEDEDKHVFGGYAPQSWALSSNFIGDNTTMLFTLSPTLNYFNATGFNDHYQYLNLHQETMPNGLGMGGQFDYWGLWLSCDYGIGHSSEVCTTFRDYKQLSKSKNFRIRNLEIWGLGKVEVDEEERTERTTTSILDKNLEDRVMLDLAGKSMHSDGLRDEENL